VNYEVFFHSAFIIHHSAFSLHPDPDFRLLTIALPFVAILCKNFATHSSPHKALPWQKRHGLLN
jgi:hypothetical protein